MLAVAAAELVVLAMTGAFLVIFYRPSTGASWADVPGTETEVRIETAVRVAHRVTSELFLLTLAGLLVLTVVLASARTLRSRRHGLTVAAAVAVWVVALFASFTGLLLPWDQLALTSVTVGSNMLGFLPIFGHRVQYVLTGGAAISVATVQRWLLVHVMAVPAVVLGLGIVVLRRLGRPVPSPDKP